LAEDVIEERTPREDQTDVVRHSLIFEKIEVAVSRGIEMNGFAELGKEIAEDHLSLANREEYLDAIICETAFDLVQAMSQTCGYEELKSYYAMAYGLLMQQGFALEDLGIL